MKASAVPVTLDVPPKRFWTATDEIKEIKFVDDYRRRYFRSSPVGQPTGLSTWTKIFPQMMQRIGQLRLFCERDLHALMVRFVPSEEVQEIVEHCLCLTGSGRVD